MKKDILDVVFLFRKIWRINVRTYWEVNYRGKRGNALKEEFNEEDIQRIGIGETFKWKRKKIYEIYARVLI